MLLTLNLFRIFISARLLSLALSVRLHSVLPFEMCVPRGRISDWRICKSERATAILADALFRFVLSGRLINAAARIAADNK